ncbi:capsid protein [Alces alces faeces associated genomovirus MP111]|uniref:Capsid protein n=1 Tax=Alces alces faeces associated genomovirus MP111 TaxID=2219111 RepID=A0A2Z5CL71_9VIRU|nr:capsid protein [Alces alces faeces associated genomovirus MP111]AXB22625.1 capsid protein [Alces alces faeces associated genomovirus MP111]
MARTWASIYRKPFRRTRPVRGGRTTRRSTKKRPTYRRKSRTMSKKRILNISSRKKRDTMAPIQQNGSSGTPAIGALNINGAPGNPGNATFVFWCATARDNTVAQGGAASSVYNPETRTATTCYMRGLKENVEMQTSTGIPWQWRRICFTYKDMTEVCATNNGGISGFYEGSNGYGRLMYNMFSSGSAADVKAYTALQTLLFRGTIGVDWNDYITAPIDTQRVGLKYDKTRVIQSGNANGMLRKYQMWHPMNKNLVYDDSEKGGADTAGYFSIGGKPGMGDFLVLDIFMPGKGSSSSDVLSFEATSTLYWHEK